MLSSPRLHFTLSVGLRFVTVAALATLMLTAITPMARAASVSRISGADRITTAVEVAQAGWDNADHVLLASAADFPDAVAAAALAATEDAPVLLTDTNQLPAPVEQTLSSLGTKRVTILGGPNSVSEEVEAELQQDGLVVMRMAGTDRFDTAAKITKSVATGRDVPVIALALGMRGDSRDAWPDALAAASLAGLDTPVPTLLTVSDKLPGVSREALQQLAPDTVIVLGGTNSVSTDVAAEVEGLGIDVVRVAGDSRYATAVEVAKSADGNTAAGSLDGAEAIFVSGKDFPDALGGGALAARRSAPLLLVPDELLDDAVDGYIRSDKTSFGAGTIIGGDNSVDPWVQKELEAAINGEPRPERVQAAGDTREACAPNSSPDCQYTYEHSIETWERLAQCESGGNWAINTGNGYYGGLQFSLRSWQWVGGQGYPHQNSKWEQIYRAELLHDRQGWNAWPACSDKLGYR